MIRGGVNGNRGRGFKRRHSPVSLTVMDVFMVLFYIAMCSGRQHSSVRS